MSIYVLTKNCHLSFLLNNYINHIFIPFGSVSPGLPITRWLRTKSACGLSGCCSVCFFSLPCRFSSVLSGVGGASSSCILRSSAASSDFSCFSSSSFFHVFPAISCNCGISRSSTSFFFLYWSMIPGILSNAFRKFMAAACVSAIARCPLL